MENNKNKDIFENYSVQKAVYTMALPAIIGQLIVLIYNIADTFFIGRTNNPLMVAGASLILPIFNITLSIASIAGIGGGALISRLLGEKRGAESKKVTSFCVYFSVIMSLLFSAGIFIFMRPLLLALGAGEGVYEYAKSYAVWVVVFGGLPAIMTNVLSNIIRSVGESKKAGFGITLGGIVNIILDPIFMFVILPEGNEITGAAIATFISNCISLLYFIIVMKKLSHDTPLGLVSITDLPEKSSIMQIFSIGLPSAVSTLLFDIDYIIIDKLMSGYSDVALASIGIVLKAERLPLNIGIGICQGMVPIVAYNYAAGNYKRMKKISDFSLLCGIVCGVFSIALYEAFSPYILNFFINDAETITLGTHFLRARCIATLFMFLSFYHVHLFNSYGRGREAFLLGIIRWVVLNIPMLFIMNGIFGMYGIVWSQSVADVINVVISVLIHRKFVKNNMQEYSVA